MPWRDATALGVLMNTRGLTELVILGIGLQLGAIPQDLYGLLVVMALVTTAATTPLLALILPSTRSARGVEVGVGPTDGVSGGSQVSAARPWASVRRR
jgi:Kef-type K+ transport system membrane component KefB